MPTKYRLSGLIILILSIMPLLGRGQIPVEVFAGHERTTLDILFFKFFKNNAGEPGKWLFFNRNRAAMEYPLLDADRLPAFGFTEAVSFNHPGLKGFAPVVVGQVFSSGVFPKAGIQYARIRKHFTLFTWSVSELKADPLLDLFLLTRYTPPLREKWQLFLQLESANSFPTAAEGRFSFIQRCRLGLKSGDWAFGAGADLTQSGRNNFTKTTNAGIFLRYEFQ